MRTDVGAWNWDFALLGIFAVAVVIAVVSGATAQTITYPTGPQITDRDAPGQIKVRLEDYAVAPDTATSPTDRTAAQVARINYMRSEPANAPDYSSRYFVPDLNGNLYTLDKTTRAFTPYLNAASIFPQFDTNPGFSAGLVTIQFDPDYANPSSSHYGMFYTTHTEIDPNLNPTDFRVGVLTAWQDTNINDNVFTGTHHEMLRVTYSGNIHPLGDISFNPNAHPGDADYDMMYIASGDGSAGESGTTSIRNQDQMLNNYLGKVLRIQPNSLQGLSAGAPDSATYNIPSDNPFASSTFTNAGAKGEIYAYGFRNPHRMSWDAATGKLIVDDIGLNSYEEIDIVHKGADYGYSKIEGNQTLSASTNKVSNTTLPFAALPVWVNNTTAFNGMTITPTFPVAEYSHTDGDAISSGFVYHGTKIPQLIGKYVFGDISTGRLFYTDYSVLLAQDAENGGNGNPATMPAIHELQVYSNGSEMRVFDIVRNRFDLRNDGVADGDHLPGQANNTDGNDPYGMAYGGGRADIRWALGTDNELYLISKSDGMIRQLLNFGDYTGIPGDFNFDGRLTNADLQALLDALKQSDTFKSAHNLADADWLALGDFNHDNVVNLADIQPIMAALTAGALQAVPEPATAMLLIVGAMTLATTYFRRKANCMK
jgi:glucose/arabinose dehydrogenase